MLGSFGKGDSTNVRYCSGAGVGCFEGETGAVWLRRPLREGFPGLDFFDGGKPAPTTCAFRACRAWRAASASCLAAPFAT